MLKLFLFVREAAANKLECLSQFFQASLTFSNKEAAHPSVVLNNFQCSVEGTLKPCAIGKIPFICHKISWSVCPDKYFQDSLTFSSKEGAYPSVLLNNCTFSMMGTLNNGTI